MRYIFLALFLLLTPAASASAVWFDSSWAYRVPVEVAPSKVGTTTPITNFPVFVDLTAFPASIYTNASTTGADLRVTKSDGSTEVAFEVVAFGPVYATTSSYYVYTSSSTFALPSNAISANNVLVEAWGGGGGGGDGANTGGSGGGGGAYAASRLNLSTSTTYNITVGTGGAKGPLTGNGSNGATTTFNGGQVLAAPGIGGLGCSSTNCAGSAGGLASLSVGSTTYSGGTGGTSNNTGDLGGGGGGAAGATADGGNASGQTAGTGTGGGGSGGVGGANAGSGANGNVPGGGGGGGENNSAGSTGNGADGMVKVTYQVATSTTYLGELHFLADSLSTTSTSTFYIYYGNPNATAYAATDTYGRNAVWVDYDFVSHYGDVDSTGNNSSITANGGVTAGGTTGPFGKATSLNGTSQSFTVNTPTGLPTGNAAYTITKWVNPNTVSGAYFGLEWGATSRATIRSGAGVFIGNYAGNGALKLIRRAGDDWGPISTMTASAWQHVAVRYNPNVVTMYRNNSLVYTSAALSNGAITLDKFTLGSNTDGTELYAGNIREWRISPSVLSQSWIETEYNNQSSPSTFFYIGAEETEGGAPAATSTDSGVIWFD